MQEDVLLSQVCALRSLHEYFKGELLTEKDSLSVFPYHLYLCGVSVFVILVVFVFVFAVILVVFVFVITVILYVFVFVCGVIIVVFVFVFAVILVVFVFGFAVILVVFVFVFLVVFEFVFAVIFFVFVFASQGHAPRVCVQIVVGSRLSFTKPSMMLGSCDSIRKSQVA